LKVLDDNGAGVDSAAIGVIQKAIQLKIHYNIRAINLSLGPPVARNIPAPVRGRPFGLYPADLGEPSIVQNHVYPSASCLMKPGTFEGIPTGLRTTSVALFPPGRAASTLGCSH
jgi:hypothetical protein